MTITFRDSHLYFSLVKISTHQPGISLNSLVVMNTLHVVLLSNVMFVYGIQMSLMLDF